MFEGVVAGILNRFLGKYIQDLDTENLNVGIFSGSVTLTDLKLKPEALYELDLPIDVKIGTIGKISFSIPWSGLYAQPVIVNVEDVLILVGPAISSKHFDPERERRLVRAAKRKILQDLESESEVLNGPQNFFENLMTAIVNNIQITMRNIHIRYEDSVSSKDGPLACGVCLQSVSIETTNNKWKPAVTPQSSNTVYQMMKIESLSLYWNPMATVLDDEEIAHITPIQFYNWKHLMLHGLDKFSMHREDFEFLLKPVTIKVKVIINRSGEARVPRLLVDSVLQDSALQLSRRQYLSISNLVDAFHRISINRKYRHYYPKTPVASNSKAWWKYAYISVVEQRVKPYTWQAIKIHRENYHRYKAVYKHVLRSPNDTELKMDLQKCEDHLPILSVVIAREQAKIELLIEEPNRIEVRESEIDWWSDTTPSPDAEESAPDFDLHRNNVELCTKAEKGRGLWNQLSSPEKKKVCELIGYVDGLPRTDKPKQYIEHKLNLTLANCSLSLMNRGKEILVLTLTQFLASLETRPATKAYKISARAESIVVEAASIENDLVPIVTAENIYNPNTNTNFLSIDFEKNPLNSEADYGINCTLEPVEVVYHEHGIAELINFFQTRSMSMQDVIEAVSMRVEKATSIGKSLLRYAIDRRKLFNISMDLKGPYFVIPECGDLHKGGNVIILDMGRVTVKSDLQPSNNALEDATCMELEERLYDRLHAECSALQVLFCDSGENWRDLRKHADSDLHLIPKIKVQIVFSNSIKKEYKLLPKYKLNVTISTLKFNLSDKSISQLLDFIDNIPLPAPTSFPVSMLDSGEDCANLRDPELEAAMKHDQIPLDPKYKQLLNIRKKVVISYLVKNKEKDTTFDKAKAKLSFLEADKTFISSEHSEEDMELWARTVDLPGFDDNISPSNCITVLLRFVIGEIVIGISQTIEAAERAYVLLKIGNVCCDAALLEYGPAIQLVIRSILLADRLHHGPSGEYLEILSTDPEQDILNVLYRKVRADCPDFRTHFHSVERSLVLDVGTGTAVLVPPAFKNLISYLQTLQQKFNERNVLRTDKFPLNGTQSLLDYFNSGPDDPPVPPGATKFSYSFRLSSLKTKLCHLDSDIMEIKITGLESDCVFKTNDRMIFKCFLNTLSVDDLSDLTLYPKLLWLDEDKVFEMKYVRHSPRIYHKDSNSGMLSANEDNVKSDGTLRLYIGRFHMVLLYRIIVDLQHFIEPLVSPALAIEAVHHAEREVESQLGTMKTWNTRLHLSIEIHAPTLLLPQKTSSPNLIVFNMGDMTVENFFKEVNVYNSPQRSVSPSAAHLSSPVLDNVLLKLDNVTLCRAVMTLGGSLEVQEPILEPISVRLDARRLLQYHTAQGLGSSGAFHRDILLCEVDGVMDTIVINLGQRDLSTILAVWNDNLSEGRYLNNVTYSSISPVEEPNPADNSVKKLQAFFAQTEPVRKEASFRFTLDGVELKLFSDVDEILSSPMRDLSRGLARFSAGEATINLDYFSDKSLDGKANLQTLLVEDIRPDTSIVIKKMVVSLPLVSTHENQMSCVSVSSPAVIEVSLRRNQAGDRIIDARLDRLRINLSPQFPLSLSRYLLDALPSHCNTADGGVVNHGYIGDLNLGNNNTAPTSGYGSQGTSLCEESPGLSVSIQFRRPELMLFTDPCSLYGRALLVRAELLLDYSHHSNRENFTVSLAGFQILSKTNSSIVRSPPSLVLHPCDVEFARSFRNTEEGVKVTASISAIEVRLSATTVHTITDIVDDILNELSISDEKDNFNMQAYNSEKSDIEDLWSPKKITPCLSNHDESNYNYIQPRYPNVEPSETFTMVVPSIRILFEMEQKQKIPVLVLTSVLEITIHDWSKQLHGKCEINILASYYNDKLDVWEPLIEPVVCNENVYRPWEVLMKVFQSKSYPMSSKLESGINSVDINDEKSKSHGGILDKKTDYESETSTDENEAADTGMTFIRNPNSVETKKSNYDASYVDGCLLSMINDDSDSENEGGAMEKLTSAIGHLFTGDTSSSSHSDSDSSTSNSGSSASHPDSPALKINTSMIDGHKKKQKKAGAKTNSVDSGLETGQFKEKMATYVIIDARDALNVTLTPIAARLLTDLAACFSQKTQLPALLMNGFDNPINLTNDIGPGSLVEIVSAAEGDISGKPGILAKAEYAPPSPASSRASSPDEEHPTRHPAQIHSPQANSPDNIECDWDAFTDGQPCDASAADIQIPNLTPTSDPGILFHRVTEQRLHIRLQDFDELRVVCPRRSTRKLHALHPAKNNTRYYILVATDTKYNSKKVVLRSPLQIRNETSYAMGVYYRKPELEAVGAELIGELTNPFGDKMRICIIEPDETYNVPLYVAYHCKLYFLPANMDNYQVMAQGLWWQELACDMETAKDVFCPAKEDSDKTVFAMRVVTVEGSAISRTSRAIPNYLLRIVPPLALHNRLPYAVDFKIPLIDYQQRIEAGEKTHIYNLNLLKTHKIGIDINYLGLPWTGTFSMSSDLLEKTINMTTDTDAGGGNNYLSLGVKMERSEICSLFLHATYWIINKTGLPMQLKVSRSERVQEVLGGAVVCVCGPSSSAGLRLRVHGSGWSARFKPAPSAPALIACHHHERNRIYHIFMQVTLSQLCPQLTRIMTLLPLFLVVNESKKPLRYMEENEAADLWLDLLPGQTAPFWPETNSMMLHVKYRDSTLVSQHFPIDKQHSTVLRMDKGTALCVTVAGGVDHPFNVTFHGYSSGDAPVRVDNLCDDLFLKLNQKDMGQVALLSPNQSTLYTWDDPTTERTLVWNIYNNKSKGFIADFTVDGYGEEKVCFPTVKQASVTSGSSVTSKLSSTLKRLNPKSPEPIATSSDDSETEAAPKTPTKKTHRDKVVVYWVSYMENFQRIFMLTQDEKVALNYRTRIESEKCNQEVFVSVSGVGLSLCIQTPKGMKELAYISVSDSQPRWEVCTARKWKLLTYELAAWIEDKYKSDQKKCQLKDYIHIDFDKMQMTKPVFAELKRTYNPAIWLHMRKSETSFFTQLKLHHFQIDNQLSDAVFPSVFHPAPLPGRIARKLPPRPCIELITLKRYRPVYNQSVYKYVKILLQEYCVNLDRGFVNHVFDIMNHMNIEDKPAVRLRADLALVHMPLTKSPIEASQTLFEYIHLSPLKLQLSLSSRGFSPESLSAGSRTKFGQKKENRPKLFNSDLLEFLFNSWGSYLCDMKDVRLRMAFFERRNTAATSVHLFNEAYSHYWTQLIQQFYVLILGLNILGNPYGVIADFTKGLGDLFYEPHLEWNKPGVASRICQAVAGLLGHTAGALNINIGLPTLSSVNFHDDYKNKRRYGYCLQKSNDLPDSIVQTNNSIAMGVPHAFGGILAKPPSGAYRTSAIRSGMGENVRLSSGIPLSAKLRMRARLPRHIHHHEGVRPYSAHSALGLQLLTEIGRGHYADSELYLAHAPLNRSGKLTLLLTTQHIFMVRTGSSALGGIGGTWNTEWNVKLDDLIGVPSIVNNTILLNYRQDENVNYFSTDEKSIEADDPQVLKWLQAKIESALIMNMEDKRCPENL